MAQQPTVSSCASNRSSLVISAALLCLFLLTAGLIVGVRRDNWGGPVVAVFGYEVRGVVYNRLTGEKLGGAELNCGDYVAVSDRRGRFALRFPADEHRRCMVTAPGFETQSVDLRAGQQVGLWLVPDPVGTVTEIMAWQKHGEFERQYELLHPDVRRSWTREEFVRLMKRTENSRVVDSISGTPKYLDSWDYFGKLFRNVAIVPTWILVESEGRYLLQYWEAHLVKFEGLWNWFREPVKQRGVLSVGRD